jgi:hypothetical protein
MGHLGLLVLTLVSSCFSGRLVRCLSALAASNPVRGPKKKRPGCRHRDRGRRQTKEDKEGEGRKQNAARRRGN